MKAKRLNLTQLTPEWHAWRKTHITATDAAKIMGKSPWGTPYSCYMEKMFGSDVKQTKAMERGIEMEPVARERLKALYGINFEPACFEHPEYPFIGCSIDAINDDNSICIEIKWPGKQTMAQAADGIISEVYQIQGQVQMMVLGLKEMQFDFEDYGESYLLTLKRDEAMIADILKAMVDFWDCLINETPPAATEKDYVVIEDNPEFEKLAKEYLAIKEQLDPLEKRKDELRKQLLELTDDGSVKGYGLTIRKSYTTTYDYKKLIVELEVDEETLNKHKKTSIRWTIS